MRESASSPKWTGHQDAGACRPLGKSSGWKRSFPRAARPHAGAGDGKNAQSAQHGRSAGPESAFKKNIAQIESIKRNFGRLITLAGGVAILRRTRSGHCMKHCVGSKWLSRPEWSCRETVIGKSMKFCLML